MEINAEQQDEYRIQYSASTIRVCVCIKRARVFVWKSLVCDDDNNKKKFKLFIDLYYIAMKTSCFLYFIWFDD